MNRKNYKYYPLILSLPAFPLFHKGNLNRRIIHWNEIISIFILIALSSCVKVYSPNINASDESKYVVTGQVTADAQTQTVNISQTTPISNPSYKPVVGCKVTIQDNEDHSFNMVDLGNGDYSTLVDPQYLVPGHVFRLDIVTPNGDSIISGNDTLQKVPPIDSIYYRIKDTIIAATGQKQKGIQFYLNFIGTSADSRYYRWSVYETWEYHASYPMEYYYDGTLHHINPTEYYAKYTCWHTRRIPEIFTITTKDLSQNKFDNLPLQNVSSDGAKLANGYSMLVEQFALSKQAYDYWNQMQINSTQEGGLYQKQPIAIRGNLHDITHPNKEVLGFFSAESASSKRIFISHVPGLTINYVKPCHAIALRAGYSSIPQSEYPAYIAGGANGPEPVWLSNACVDCTVMGGVTNRPSFWPKNK